MNRIVNIRAEEKKYHDLFYANHTLYEPGTWLHKPVKSVIDLLEEYKDQDYLSVLDLGSGVGRNSIPIAESMINRDGKVVCVDLLQSALEKLNEYSKKYGVERFIETRLSDIKHFEIEKEEYDVIVAVSALEHVSSVESLNRKLNEMGLGTKPFGSNCIIISSNIKEVLVETNEILDPMFEINISTESVLLILDNHYSGWEIKQRIIKPLDFDIDRNGREVKLSSDCITYVAKRTV